MKIQQLQSGVRGQEGGVGQLESGVRGQKGGVGQLESGVRGQGREGVSRKPRLPGWTAHEELL